VIAETVNQFAERFTFNSRYVEFLYHSEMEEHDFAKQLKSASLLRLAQQIVHAHVNMGLPQGDFAPVASTEVRVPNSVAAFVTQFGEFAVPALGTRFLHKDYVNLVKSIVHTADMLMTENADRSLHVMERAWLPMARNDGHTKQIIASRLNDFLWNNAGVRFRHEHLEDAVMSGARPPGWDDIKDLFGDDPAARDRFDFLFRAYPASPQFVTAFTGAAAAASLQQLDLRWDSPQAGDVDWNYNAKEAFTRLSDNWARKNATYAQFFEMSSSQSNRHAATGSQSQLATVTTRDSVTVVRTELALSAPEFSLVACFPASGIFSGGTTQHVVVTTPLAVNQRATEFVQLDWR
jgi:hypothetical protein